jgi:hypothetical protein
MKLLIAVGLLVAGQASAQVYRCESGGRVEYSESPCAVGGRQVDTRPSSEGVTGLKRDAALVAGREQSAATAAQNAPKPKRRTPVVTCVRTTTPGGHRGYPKCTDQ